MSNDKEVCYVCGESITEDEWVIPLETFKAAYRGDGLVLDRDNTVETILHAECLGE